MPYPDGPQGPVELLAKEFIDRHRRGESPSIEEYAKANPNLAESIRALFPTLVILDQAAENDQVRDKPAAKGSSGDTGGASSKVVGPIERIGEYRIVREIGRGGMGVVYEAQQESLGRRVALKVMSESFLSSPNALDRFRREAQAAARLHHTNIVPVFDIGEDRGRHFYVMQYIDGSGLDRVLLDGLAPTVRRSGEPGGPSREIGRSLFTGRFDPTAPMIPDENTPKKEDGFEEPAGNRAASESTRIDIAEPFTHSEYFHSVAGIGAQCAGALDYAHRQGTLHRDIKPANLLLDPHGTVWITDFGLAKLIERDDLTASGDMVGTLRYMSPEQFEGRADCRSDVYNLGLTLYELLTLRPAFDESSHHRLLKQVSEGNPPRPRSINGAIPRDLETIVLKAIAHAPANRYQTAGEMADDLQRFLNDRPILARRIGLLERAWRWCRRNRALAALSGLAAGLVLLLMILGAVAYHNRTEALARTTAEQLRAEANLNLAIRAFEDVFAELGEGATAESLRNDEGLWTDVTAVPVLSENDVRVLNTLLKFYDRFIERNENDLALRADTARAHARVGRIEAQLGRRDRAETAFERALALYDDLAATADNPEEYLVEMAAILNYRAELRFPDACGVCCADCRRALEYLRRIPEGTSVDRRARLEEAKSHKRLAFLELVRHHREMAPLTESAHELMEAHMAEAFRILGRLLQVDPKNREYRLQLAQAYFYAWGIARMDDRVEGAVASRRQSLSLLRELVDEAPENPEYRVILAEVLLFSSIGKPGASDPLDPEDLVLLKEAASLLDGLRRRYPQVPRYGVVYAFSQFALGNYYLSVKDTASAEACYETALAIEEAYQKGGPRLLGTLRRNWEMGLQLARLRLMQDRPGDAKSVLESMLRAVGEEDGSERPPNILLSMVYETLADVQERTGDKDATRDSLEKARRLREAGANKTPDDQD